MSAPKSVLYGDQLPLGLEAKATKKLFFPTTGETYTPDGNKTIRIDINYDGMLDTQQSFIQMKLKNTSGGVAAFDIGQSVIKKLTLSSGGVVLEEISDYNTLFSNILLPSQGGDQTLTYERNNITGINFENGALTVPSAANVVTDTAAASAIMAVADTDITAAESAAFAANLAGANAVNTKIDAAINKLRVEVASANGATGALHTFADAQLARFAVGAVAPKLFYSTGATAATQTASHGALANTTDVVVNYKLVSGLLDNDKYLPLVLMNAGITIEIELESAANCMFSAAVAVGDLDYQVSAVRYVGHTIDLQRDFYDRLRMVQQNSGGVLQIVGQSYRGFRGNVPAAGGEAVINCPARVRSIKSFFFAGKATEAAVNNSGSISRSGTMGLSSIQLAIGSTRYPPTATQFNALNNKNGGYTELMKAFGKVGSTTHRDLLGSNLYTAVDGTAAQSGVGSLIPFCPFGIDLESFRHQIENGIDTSSRALPIQLHLNKAATGVAAGYDLFMYVLYDTIYYINMDGSVSVSS